jgi:uncharacterized tellurite resistance protein B-like protein
MPTARLGPSIVGEHERAGSATRGVGYDGRSPRMLFSRKKPTPPPSARAEISLSALVGAQLSEPEPETVQLVAALTGLLACVAYADRHYSEAEQAHVRRSLSAVHGLPPAGVEAICNVLRDHIVTIAVSNMHVHTRVLRELGDLELRREVLDVLVELAAADGELALAETDLLRRTASSMGLTADDYLASQARHRDKLRTLR